ncbi:MAG: hypothetical protein MUD14_08685 [Hydrococcus sp. Prado102]|jgi:hypothetical protein|nr:hypothetical protein [Hydrococcus sp. Prado102]
MIYLSDLYQKIQEQSEQFFPSFQVSEFSEISQSLQQQFDLLVKQKQLGLPIKSLLASNPLLADWMAQLEQLIPGLFKPNKKLYLDYPLTVKLLVNKKYCHWLQVPVNLAIIRNRIRLLKWAIRSPKLNWQDRIKLWVTCEFLKLNPNELAITICAFYPNKLPKKVIFNWNEKEHKKTQKFLQTLLSDRFVSSSNHSLKANSFPSYSLNLDEIPEVSI